LLIFVIQRQGLLKSEQMLCAIIAGQSLLDDVEEVLMALASLRGHMPRQANGPAFDVREALYALLGKDLTQIHGLGPYLALKLVAECGDDLSAWPSAKHFTSWLCLAPSNKISGGKVLSSRTRRSGSRVAALLRLAAVTVGRTETALGAFYRRLSARIGKAKAVTATARKIAVLFYNALRHGMDYVDPGASYYETRYRERVIGNLHRRAKAFGFILQQDTVASEVAVS
jgi:transposase